MAKNTWFISDTHFGHDNIVKFTVDGTENTPRIRPFSSIEEHDEHIVEEWNKLIKPEDRVYHLGDVVINRKHLPILSRLNGHKKLVKGNHDIFKLSDYTPYFEDILAYRIYPAHGVICSHIPVHTSNLESRFKRNVHGHTHYNLVKKFNGFDEDVIDKRYKNVCVEHTNWKPVHFDEVISNAAD